MGKLVGLLSSGIGLVAEASAARRPPTNNRTRFNPPLSYRPRNISQDAIEGPSSYDPGNVNGNASDTSSCYKSKGFMEDEFDAPPPYSDTASKFDPCNPQPNREPTVNQNDENYPYYPDSQDTYALNRDPKWGRDNVRANGSRAYSGPTTPYKNGNDGDIVQSFAYQHPRPRGSIIQGGLPCPVVIPQRRPENKSRGWMLAYAPVLNDCGIDQATFLDFLNSFNEASKASPYLDAVNVAAFGVGFAPGITPMIISMAVPVAVKYAKAAQTDKQTNTFLGRMNAQLFEPHGLFAIVMTFKPEQQSTSLPIDSSSASGRVVQGLGRDRTRDQSNTTYGEVQLPPSAPLIFPSSDELPTGPQGNNLQKTGHFVADYFDRRGQAQYAQKNPNSALSGPGPQFKSRWGDPTHPANNGSLISLVSGGVINRQNKDKDKDKDDRKSRRRRRRSSSSSSSDSDGDEKGKGPGLIGSLKGAVAGPGGRDQGLIKGAKGRMMQTDVLYLMIVNKPTEDPITAAQNTASAIGGMPELDQTPGYRDLRNDYAPQYGGYSGYSDQRAGYAGWEGPYPPLPEYGYASRGQPGPPTPQGRRYVYQASSWNSDYPKERGARTA